MTEEFTIEGRNAVLEAYRAGKTIDKLYVQDGVKDGPIQSIIREAKKQDTIVNFVSRERLNQMSEEGHHQGVIAHAAAYEYAEVEDILKAAEEKGEPPFIFLLDGIEDPHNLGAIIRTAEAAGAHGVIIPKRRSASLTQTVYKTSAGAASVLPVCRVANLKQAVDLLKKDQVWIYSADMDGQPWCGVDYTGGVALVVGSEGHGVSRLLKEQSDFVVSLPMNGQINSLNASVAAGILMYEITRQRTGLRAK